LQIKNYNTTLTVDVLGVV